MREVVIQSWCDECAAKGVDTEGTPFDIAWGGRTVALDLCDEHSESITELNRLVDAYGKPVPSANGAAKRKKAVRSKHNHLINSDGEYQCPDCSRAFETPQGLGAHRYRAHDRHVTV